MGTRFKYIAVILAVAILLCTVTACGIFEGEPTSAEQADPFYLNVTRSVYRSQPVLKTLPDGTDSDTLEGYVGVLEEITEVSEDISCVFDVEVPTESRTDGFFLPLLAPEFEKASEKTAEQLSETNFSETSENVTEEVLEASDMVSEEITETSKGFSLVWGGVVSAEAETETVSAEKETKGFFLQVIENVFEKASEKTAERLCETTFSEIDEKVIENVIEEATEETFDEVFAVTSEEASKGTIAEIVSEVAPAEMPEEEFYLDYYSTDLDSFVPSLIAEYLVPYYEVFIGTITTRNGNEVFGLAFSDLSEAYRTEDGRVLFACGFVCVEGEISIDDLQSGLEVIDYEYDLSDEYGFVLSYTMEDIASHFVLEEQYVTYGVKDGAVFWNVEKIGARSIRALCNTSLGDLYSFDECRVLYTEDVGKYVTVSGSSLYELVDFDAIKAEIDAVLDVQDAAFLTVDVQTAVYVAQEALESYLLSIQEETFFGYRIDDLLKISGDLDPMEYIRITADGIELLEFTPTPPPEATAFMKWMTGICAGIAVIGAVALTVVLPVAGPMTLALSGMVIGAAIESFSQVVIQSISVENINWAKVGVSSIAGAISALPGVGICADAVIGGCTEAVFALMDGGDFEDAAASFAFGTVAGIVLGAAFKAIGKGVQKIAGRVSSPPSVARIAVVDDMLNLDGKIANKIDDPLVDAATYQTEKSFINIQLFASKADDTSSLVIKPNESGSIVEGTLKVSTGNRQSRVVNIKRKVYQYSQDIDFNYQRADGLTNYQAMLDGKAPVVLIQGSDGMMEATLELHHLTQQEIINFPGSEFSQGSLLEIPATVHDKYSKVLHIQYPKEDGIRRSMRVVKLPNHKWVKSFDERQYEAFRKLYWKTRALEYSQLAS